MTAGFLDAPARGALAATRAPRAPRRVGRPRAGLRRHVRAAPARGGGRHGERHGRARRPARLRPAALRGRVPLPRARRHVPQPPRGPDPAREPGRPPGPGHARSGADVGLAFDGDADRVFLIDEHGEGVSGSLTTALVAVVDAGEVPRLDGPLQPDLLEGRARDRHRARRDAGAHPRRPQLHQAGDGRDRGGLRRRALRALLLPRQLPRRLGHHHRDAGPRADVLERPRRSPSSSHRSAATPTRASATPRSPTPPAPSSGWHGPWRAPGPTLDRLDGLTCDFGDWWFNVRPSNTEPLLRLNVEAADEPSLAAHTRQALDLIEASAERS